MWGRKNNELLKQLQTGIAQILSNQGKEMGTLTDLETILTTIQGEMTTLGTDVDAIIAKLSASGTVPDADIAALQSISDGIKAASGKIEAAVTPPPPPAPAP